MTGLPEGQLAFYMPDTVQSVVRCPTNGPLLAAAAQLWFHAEDLVVDVTYGRGNFWTHYRPGRLVAHDLALDGVDFRNLPEADRTIDVVVFDPPYIAQGGPETSTVPDFIDRYGLRDAPKSRWDLEELIAGGIKEAARVLRPGGRLLVKCMDYVNGGQFVSGRHQVVTVALAAGLELVDELVHYSGCGPQPEVNLDGSPRRQEHARRAHSFLCVFRARARRSRTRMVVLNGGRIVTSGPSPLPGPRPMEATGRVPVSSDSGKRQGEDRGLSGSLRRLGLSTDEVTPRFEDILHRGKPGLRRPESVVPLQPADRAAEEEGAWGELRAPVNRRSGLWNRSEDVTTDVRWSVEGATPDTTDKSVRGRRPLT